MSGVRVNEVKVFATTQGADWWAWFLLAHPATRFDARVVSMAGSIVDVACDDADHAEWLAAEMQRHGIPRTALQVIR